jgi:hypothetical protein
VILEEERSARARIEDETRARDPRGDDPRVLWRLEQIERTVSDELASAATKSPGSLVRIRASIGPMTARLESRAG